PFGLKHLLDQRGDLVGRVVDGGEAESLELLRSRPREIERGDVRRLNLLLEGEVAALALQPPQLRDETILARPRSRDERIPVRQGAWPSERPGDDEQPRRTAEEESASGSEVDVHPV